MKTLLKLIGGCLLALSLLTTGCSPLPLRPGRAAIVTESGKQISVRQSQNPLNETTQDYKRVTDTQGTTTEEVHTKIGAAQKDVAREMAAKLGAMRPVMWVGILLFLFGAASLVYPPLKLIVASTTTSLVLTASGLAMIVLPSLVVGNEVLIMAVGLGAAGLYWFSHRHGKLQGVVDQLKGK